MSWGNTFWYDNRVCRSCGKQYKYRAWASKHFWSCSAPNDDHKEARRLAKIPTYWEKKMIEDCRIQLGIAI